MEAVTPRRRLSINRCPIHKEWWSVSVDNENGGTRVTLGKCCGQWRMVKEWKLSPSDWRELAELCEEAAQFEEGP